MEVPSNVARRRDEDRFIRFNPKRYHFNFQEVLAVSKGKFEANEAARERGGR